MTGPDDQAVPEAGDGSLSSRLRTLLARLDAAAAGNGGEAAPATPGDRSAPDGAAGDPAAGDGDGGPPAEAPPTGEVHDAGAAPADGLSPVGGGGPAAGPAREPAAPGDGEPATTTATPSTAAAEVPVAPAGADDDGHGDGDVTATAAAAADDVTAPAAAAPDDAVADHDSAGPAPEAEPVAAVTSAAGDADHDSARATPDAEPATTPPAPEPAHPEAPVRRRYRRVRAAAFGTTLALLVGAIPVLTWLGVETISDSSRGQVIEPETDADAPGFEALVEPTPTLLLAHVDEEGGLAGLTVLGLGFGDEGGDVLFVPVGTLADIASGGVDRLAVAFDRGGIDLVRETTESLLDVRFTEVVEVDAARWAVLVGPVAPLSVTNPDPVVVLATDGSATVAFPAGNIEVAAEDVSALLATRSTDETQLARLVRHQAFWEAWLGAVRAAPPGSAVPGEVTTGIGRFVRGLAAGDVVYETLRVASAPATPDGEEAYEADPDAVAAQISELLPFAAAPEGGDRARVRVLNGTGDPALTPVVTRVLVPAGAEIAVIGNADRFDYDRTQVVYYDQAQAAVAERLRDAMGVGEVVLSSVPNDAVDVTVVVGSDFALPAATEGGQDGGSDSTG